MAKNQHLPSGTDSKYLKLSEVARIFNMQPQTLRQNLDAFSRWGASAILRTPGRHVRIHIEAVEYVRLHGFQPRRRKADDIVADLQR